MPLLSPYYVFTTWAELDSCVFQQFTMSHSRRHIDMWIRRHCNLSVVILLWCALFLFFFFACRKLFRGSLILTPHTKHIPQGGLNIKASVRGYNPFEMQLSVRTHRQGWNRAWLWGVTLPRCLAQSLTLPGLQQRLHTGMLVLPLVCVPTNYPFKDSIQYLVPLASLL